MFVVLALVLNLVQSPGNRAVAQSSSQETITPKLSSTEITQLQSKGEAGDASAQPALGRAYQDGNGVPKNDELATKWYRNAAEQGNPTAQNNLGIMYRTGSGVEKSKEEAVNWYRRAALQGYASAMFNLGTAYYNGDGVQIDDVTAYAWFLLAADAGNEAALDAVRRSEDQMRPGGIKDGLLKVAEMYESGVGVAKNYSAAAKWYGRGAERDVPEAQIKLAGMLFKGLGVLQDYGLARHWCEVAAKKYPPGAYCLGRIYREGVGVPKNPEFARKWFLNAAEHGDGTAMLQLGEMYRAGDGAKPDRITGYSWLLLAFSCRVSAAEQEALSLQSEMSSKEIEKAKKKAAEFLRAKPFARLRIPASTQNGR